MPLRREIFGFKGLARNFTVPGRETYADFAVRRNVIVASSLSAQTRCVVRVSKTFGHSGGASLQPDELYDRTAKLRKKVFRAATPAAFSSVVKLQWTLKSEMSLLLLDHPT